jgi:hypothetical protein
MSVNSEYRASNERMADPGGPRTAWVCGRSLAMVAGTNPAGGVEVCLSLENVVCCPGDSY